MYPGSRAPWNRLALETQGAPISGLSKTVEPGELDVTTVQEIIPDELRPQVDAALAWFNQGQDVAFEVTGILDPEASQRSSDSTELRLILCGGDRCEQRSFRVAPKGNGFDVALTDEPLPAGQQNDLDPKLDPPPGARRTWLDGALAAHSFVVLIFYRGFW